MPSPKTAPGVLSSRISILRLPKRLLKAPKLLLPIQDFEPRQFNLMSVSRVRSRTQFLVQSNFSAALTMQSTVLVLVPSPKLQLILGILLNSHTQIPGGTFDPIAEASFADFKRLQEVNVNGTFLVVSSVSAAMKSQEPRPISSIYPERGTTRGAIVNLASVSSYISVPSMVQYTTSKYAMLGITKTAGM